MNTPFVLLYVKVPVPLGGCCATLKSVKPIAAPPPAAGSQTDPLNAKTCPANGPGDVKVTSVSPPSVVLTPVKVNPAAPSVVNTCPARPSVIPKFNNVEGIVGAPIKSVYAPVADINASVGFPDKSVYAPVEATSANVGIPVSELYAPLNASVIP